MTDCVGNFLSLGNFTNLQQLQVSYVRFRCIRGKFKDKLIWPHSNSGLDFIVFSYEKDYTLEDNYCTVVSAWLNSIWARFESLILPFKRLIFLWK